MTRFAKTCTHRFLWHETGTFSSRKVIVGGRRPFVAACRQVFDYDYAPTSERVGVRKVWINVSQEARDDLDDLMEFGLIKGFRLCSEEGLTESAYQVRGMTSR